MSALPTTGRVTIRAPAPMYVLRLLDRRFWEVASSSTGELRKSVAPGWYMARCEMGGPAMQKSIRIVAGEHIEYTFESAAGPSMPSAAPVAGAQNNHEYYQQHALELSRAAHADLRRGSGACRLVILNRRLSEDSSTAVTLKGFHLLDARGRVVSNLVRHERKSGEAVRRREDRQFGRASYSLDLTPGGYLLAWPSGSGRRSRTCLPLWLPTGWVTSVFLGVAGEQTVPEPDRASIHMGPRNGDRFGMHTAEGTATELALASLRTGRRQLTDRMLREMLHAKFSNPMCGLLGAYMLCEREEPDWDLFGVVLNNLRGLIPGHPDLEGLAAVALKRGWAPKRTWTSHPITFPAVVRSGLRALSDLEWQDGMDLLTSYSLAEVACRHMTARGPWTLFTKIQQPVSKKIVSPYHDKDLANTITTRNIVIGRINFLPESEDRSSPTPEVAVEATKVRKIRKSITRKLARRPPAGAFRTEAQSTPLNRITKLFLLRHSGFSRQTAEALVKAEDGPA
jgi:hypothetical protein